MTTRTAARSDAPHEQPAAVVESPHAVANTILRLVLTDIPAQRRDGVWCRNTTYVGPPAWANRVLPRLGWRPLRRVMERAATLWWGVRLWRARGAFEAAVTTGAGPGMVFALLQAVPGFGRIPHVMIDCLWYRERDPVRRLANRIKLRLAARSVARFVVWARCEIEDYAREFGVPARKFEFVPFHASLEDYDFDLRDRGYVFAGGDGDRDYETLLEAVRGLEVPVVIATRRAQWRRRRDLPANITVVATDPRGFRRTMAGARVVVVPMAAGLVHRGGQQTYLNAMAMGKPVIVCDDAGGPDYVDDGMTGLVVPAGCAPRLRSALQRVLQDRDFARELGRRAALAVKRRGLETDACMQRVLAVAGRCRGTA